MGHDGGISRIVAVIGGTPVDAAAISSRLAAARPEVIVRRACDVDVDLVVVVATSVEQTIDNIRDAALAVPPLGVAVVHGATLSVSDALRFGRAGADAVFAIGDLFERAVDGVCERCQSSTAIARLARGLMPYASSLGLFEFERALRAALVFHALEQTAGNRSHAARALLVPRLIIQRVLRKERSAP